MGLILSGTATDNISTLASVLGALADAGASGAVTESDTVMAYIKQLITQNAAMKIFAGNTGVVVVPGTGADLDFPDVVVAGLPTGVHVVYADAVLVVGSTYDVSGSENQIKTGTTDAIYVMLDGATWGTNDISAIPVPALSFETAASSYGSGGAVWGNTDISSVITGNGTYNFRSEETNRTKGLEATGTSLELHTVSIIVRVWHN